MSNLIEEATKTGELLAILENRLAPIIHSGPTCADSCCQKEELTFCTQLGGAIHEVRSMLSAHNYRIGSLLNDLEL